MSVATLEGNKPVPGDQPTDKGKETTATASTRPQWAESLGTVEDDLTGGSHEEQKEAGRAIIRIAVDQGEKLRGPDKLTGDTMAEHFAWSPRWWRERLREVREAADSTKLTVVTDSPASPSAGAPAEAVATADLRADGTEEGATRATEALDERATGANGRDGKTVAGVASPHPAPAASPAPTTVPSVPPTPQTGPDGSTGHADLAVAQHTARGSRGTSQVPVGRSGHVQHPGSRGVTGKTGTATTGFDLHPTDVAPSTWPGPTGPAQPTRSSATGWPERAATADAGAQPYDPPSTAPQAPSEPAPASIEATAPPRSLQDREEAPVIVPDPSLGLQDLASELAAAWGAGEQHARPRQAPRAVQGPVTTDVAVASPLPATSDEPAAPLPPADRTDTAPLPPTAPQTAPSTELSAAGSQAGPALATPAERQQPRATPPVADDEPAIVASTAHANGTLGQAQPAVASHSVPATEITGAAKLQYAFYGTASLFALIGQVWAALDHITIGGGWPTWVQALAMAPALAVIELAGVATSHQADLRRRLGEQAYGYRALSLMAAMVAAGVNLLGHWGEWFPAVGFTGLSVFAYCSWLMQSAARRRDALRAAGQMANTAPVFGPIQWIRQPRLTWRARLIAIGEGRGRSESLLLAAERMHRETRDKAIAKAVQKVIKTQKKDANGAIIAAATIDPDTLATALKARTDYAAWTDHLSVDLAPPVRDAG
ncbi:hypothetical protein AB0F43_31760 [Kribbella sp. NPDC023972]|uniref:hypothetical protein n=1 Tax=Kribbella sp. NPDC023972 TaxID=3154795 RepID=UPI0033F4A702